jgi:hypothetical protein
MERVNRRSKRLQNFTRAVLLACIFTSLYAAYLLARPVYWHIIGSSARIEGPAFDSRKQLYEELQKTGKRNIYWYIPYNKQQRASRILRVARILLSTSRAVEQDMHMQM